MKVTITVMVILAILICGFVFEQIYVNDITNDLSEKIESLFAKTVDETLTLDELQNTIDWWTAKKETAQFFINHDIVNNLDTYLSEARGYLINSKYDLALGQISSAKDVANNIFDNILFNFGNIF